MSRQRIAQRDAAGSARASTYSPVGFTSVADRDSQEALVTVDHIVLDQLVEAATTDASADEVTPPLTAGPAWTPTRIAWLRDFHSDRRAGLDGPAREATWAITVDQRVVGSVRLQRTERPGLLETGVWLTRSTRGHGGRSGGHGCGAA